MEIVPISGMPWMTKPRNPSVPSSSGRMRSPCTVSRGESKRGSKYQGRPVQERLLFNLNGPERGQRQAVPAKERSSKARYTEPAQRIYDKDLVEHA